MIIYGVEQSYVLKEGYSIDYAEESLKAAKEWGWNEDKTK